MCFFGKTAVLFLGLIKALISSLQFTLVFIDEHHRVDGPALIMGMLYEIEATSLETQGYFMNVLCKEIIPLCYGEIAFLFVIEFNAYWQLGTVDIMRLATIFFGHVLFFDLAKLYSLSLLCFLPLHHNIALSDGSCDASVFFSDRRFFFFNVSGYNATSNNLFRSCCTVF